MEAKSGSAMENSVGEKLPYYGGALGRYLVIDPSGKMSIVGERRPPEGPKEEPEEGESSSEEQDEHEESGGSSDTVSISQPPENASIAEAKPVAVSVAGVGGMASAQPIATAVVGPGGLAISRPVATAIAGIKGAEELVPLRAPQQPQPSHRISGQATADSKTDLVYNSFQPQTLFYYSVPVY